MHIGKENSICIYLKVRNKPMDKVTENNNLGDVVSNNGSNMMKIKSRLAKGTSIIGHFPST